MRSLISLILLAMLFSLSARAVPPILSTEECGLYQAEDFGDTIVYSLIDTLSIPQRTVTFTISNPKSETVAQMLNLRCYCVVGSVRSDPEFRDSLFKLIRIDRVSSGPYMGCNP